MRRQTIVLVAVVIVLLGCFGCARPVAPVEPPVKSSVPASVDATDVALAQVSARAGVKLASVFRTVETTVPASFSDGAWFYYQTAAVEGGYDFTPYRGRAVTVTGYLIDRPPGLKGGVSKLWVVRSQGKLIGAYLTADDMTPGVYGIGPSR